MPTLDAPPSIVRRRRSDFAREATARAKLLAESVKNAQARAEMVQRHDGQVFSNPYNPARDVACSAAGACYVELYAGHSGSFQHSHEITAKRNGDCGIGRDKSYRDRQMKPGKVVYDFECNRDDVEAS